MTASILTSLFGRRFGIAPNRQMVVADQTDTPFYVPRFIPGLTAAGTALTNTTTETSLASVTIPANSLDSGSIIKVRFQGIATATNSTDTLTVKLYIGTAGIGGTALISMAATDVANNDVFQGEYELVIRTTGSSGTMVGCGTFKSIPAAEGTMTIKDDILASTTIDTTVNQVIMLAGTWSVANAGNSCRADLFNVMVA